LLNLADLDIGDGFWVPWPRHWAEADGFHMWFQGISMALPQAPPWPLTMGINDVF